MRHPSCFRGVCVLHWGNRRAIRLSCKKFCSWRALEEEGQRSCVTLAGDLLGNAAKEAMLKCTQGGSVGGCQIEGAQGGGSPKNKITLGGRLWRYEGSM